MNKKLRGSIILTLATIIWGSTFVAQSMGMDHIGPFTFQAARCALAVLFLFPLSWILERDKKQFFSRWSVGVLWKAGLFCGGALFLAAGLQQVGLVSTTAGKAGFLTALYIVIVPVIGIFIGKRAGFTVWIGVALAIIGLYLLNGASFSAPNLGDALLMGCAFWFAVQITLVDRYVSFVDGIKLSCLQSLVCAVLSGVAAVLTEEISMESLLNCAGPLLYAGVMSMGVAYTLQIVGQKHLAPTPASLIMSLESVFALLTGWLVLRERMQPVEILGCGLVFCAVILSQIPAKRK